MKELTHGRGRKVENIKDYQRALKAGYGLGQGDEYTPWYRIQDYDSSKGRRTIKGLTTNRSHDLMTASEIEFFYIVDFCDSVIDVREQFPLIPLNLSQKIARTFDIPHPVHPKSKEPLILTTTFLLSRKIENTTTYHAVSVEPELTRSNNHYTYLYKLDIERIWWSLLGVPFQPPVSGLLSPLKIIF